MAGAAAKTRPPRSQLQELKFSAFRVISLSATSALPEIKTPPNSGRRFCVVPEWTGPRSSISKRASADGRAVSAESWHKPFSGASVILCRSPELHPVEGRRGVSRYVRKMAPVKGPFSLVVPVISRPNDGGA
jgi:hypothetical protein